MEYLPLKIKSHRKMIYRNQIIFRGLCIWIGIELKNSLKKPISGLNISIEKISFRNSMPVIKSYRIS